MDDQEQRWPLVGRAIERRMAELGMDQAALVRKSQLSDITVRSLQRGEAGKRRRGTFIALASALRWPDDFVERILDGADPGEIRDVAVGTSVAPAERDIQLDASGVDLEELRLTDPDAYEQLLDLARLYLDRARARREGSS